MASSSASHANDGAMRSSISLSLSEKMPRSSVASMDATDVPSTRTPCLYFSRRERQAPRPDCAVVPEGNGRVVSAAMGASERGQARRGGEARRERARAPCRGL